MGNIVRKNGGMWFWRIGRFGGSFYVTKKPTKVAKPTRKELAAKAQAEADAYFAERIAAIRERRT